MSPIAISRNDPQLAHGAARSVHAHQNEIVDRHTHKLCDARSVKQFVGLLNQHFKDQIIDLQVDRPYGSRASASVILLLVTPRGNFTVGKLRYDARKDRRVSVSHYPVTIDRHAIARAFQRTTGVADMAEVIRRAGLHLAMAAISVIDWRAAHTRPSKVTIVGQGIALLGTFDGEWLDIGTWIEGATAADPEIRRLAASEGITVF